VIGRSGRKESSRTELRNWDYAIVAKAEGLQRQSGKGAALANLLQTLANAGSGDLRLYRRVKEVVYNRPDPRVLQ
jgi:hypothetical protein